MLEPMKRSKSRLLKTADREKYAVWIDNDDLDRLIIPLLGEMVDVSEQQPLEASSFYSKLITTYIERVVQREPQKPQNWSLPDDAQKYYFKDCTFCSPVREFLKSPTQEHLIFDVPAEKHYEFQLHLPYYYETREESGESSKIKVTKTFSSWEGQHEEWRCRFGHAQTALGTLPQARLRQIIGEDDYQDLMDLRIVKLPAATSDKEGSNSAEAATDTDGKSALGRKRTRTESF